MHEEFKELVQVVRTYQGLGRNKQAAFVDPDRAPYEGQGEDRQTQRMRCVKEPRAKAGCMSWLCCLEGRTKLAARGGNMPSNGGLTFRSDRPIDASFGCSDIRFLVY